jgi:hypothetical protein
MFSSAITNDLKNAQQETAPVLAWLKYHQEHYLRDGIFLYPSEFGYQIFKTNRYPEILAEDWSEAACTTSGLRQTSIATTVTPETSFC